MECRWTETDCAEEIIEDLRSPMIIFYQSGHALDYTRQMNTSYHEDLDRIFLFVNNPTNWKRNDCILLLLFSSLNRTLAMMHWKASSVTVAKERREREANCLFSLTFPFLECPSRSLESSRSDLFNHLPASVDDMYPLRSFNRSMNDDSIKLSFSLQIRHRDNGFLNHRMIKTQKELIVFSPRWKLIWLMI